jgi:calcineurin-like phosphoesterase family protein
MSIFVTSDTHWNHENVIWHSSRPFETLEFMTEALIENWNSVVTNNDQIWHLGDVIFTRGRNKDAELVDSILSRLNGQKFLITGNHDREEVTRSRHWQAVYPMHEIKVKFSPDQVHAQRIVLCHYALRTWNQMHRGAWMLHGHSHGNLQDIGGKIMDVGVDCNGYRPISLDKIKTIMDARPIVSYDHHRPESNDT